MLLRLSRDKDSGPELAGYAILAVFTYPRRLPADMKAANGALDSMAKDDDDYLFPALRTLVSGLARLNTHESVGYALMVLRHWESWLLEQDHLARDYDERRAIAYAAGELAGALVRQGRIDEAEQLVRYDRSEMNGSPILDAIALAAARSGHDRASELFERAVDMVDGSSYAATRSRAFGALALKLPARQDALLSLARELSATHPGGLNHLVPVLTEAGRFNEAKTAALAIEDDKLRANAVGNVILALLRAGETAEAGELLAVLRHLVEGNFGALIQTMALADTLAQRGWLDESRTIRESVGVEDDRRRFWAHVAHGRVDEALEAARALPPDLVPESLVYAAGALAGTDLLHAQALFDKAIEAAQGADRYLMELVWALAKQELLTRAAEVASQIGEPAQRAMAWAGGAKVAVENGATPPREWLHHAENALDDVAPTERNGVLRMLANAAVTLGVDPAPILARIDEPDVRTSTLSDIAGIEASRGDLPAALEHYPHDDLEAWLEWLLECSVEAFHEAATIASWVSPQWARLCSTAWPTGTS